MDQLWKYAMGRLKGRGAFPIFNILHMCVLVPLYENKFKIVVDPQSYHEPMGLSHKMLWY
jgi:hypothetical protein